jgi:hypothetical protein
MARPKKIGLSYFPLDCIMDEKFRAFESVFKNDGFVWMIKFWQTAYQSENGCVDFDGIYGVIHPENSRITPGKHLEFLSMALKLGLIRQTEEKLYTSNGIQKRILTIYGEREKDRNRGKNELSDRKPPGKPPDNGGNGNINLKDKNKYVDATDIESVYTEYPARCPIKARSTGKGSKNKNQIRALLQKHTKDELINIIRLYVSDAKKTGAWIKNFTTFLNNLPDMQSIPPIPAPRDMGSLPGTHPKKPSAPMPWEIENERNLKRDAEERANAEKIS